MKQLYYTMGETGKCLNPKGSPGGRVRAASAGLAPDRVQAAVRYAGTAARTREALEAAPSSPPVRLAFLNTREAGRFLCHSTCLDGDAAAGKNGQFFSHLLLDVPPSLDAQHAIQSWGSPLWQRVDHGGGGELPEALYLPVASVLGDAELHQFLATSAHRELVRFLLAALLSTPPETRIFVVAPAETVALCIYGITRALPPDLLTDFTFSTYESDPLACPARLIGTCFEDTTGHDLPAACYERSNAAYNLDTGRQSALTGDLPFVDFAVQTLADGTTAPLDEFHATWQRLGIKEPNLFELVYRLSQGAGNLSREESQRVLHHPTLCSWVVMRQDALDQFLEWALSDQAYAATTFARAVAALRQQPDILAKLARTIQDRGLAALREGDVVRTRNALEALMPMVAPARAASLWTDLLKTIADPECLSWEMRCYLLPYLVRLRPLQVGQAPDAVLERWLRFPADRLGQLLALDLPYAYQLAVSVASIRKEGEPTAALARGLAVRPELVLAVMERLAAQPEEEGRALALFKAVLEEALDHPWAEDLIRSERAVPVGLVDQCLEAALETNRVQVPALVQNHGLRLLELLARRPSLDRLTAAILDRRNHDLLTDTSLEEFLAGVGKTEGLRAEVRSRLDAYLAVRAFLVQPSLDRETLGAVAAALRLEPPLFPAALGEHLLSAIVSAWTVQPDVDGLQGGLERVLLTLGSAWSGGPAELYRDLVRSLRKHKTFWKQVDQLHAVLAVALGAGRLPELAGHLENLDAEAYALAQQVACLGGKKILAALDKAALDWPRGARSQWGFLSKAVRPRELRDLLRDCCLVGWGVLAGGGAILIWEWIRTF